jgi:hypothetical protein
VGRWRLHIDADLVLGTLAVHVEEDRLFRLSLRGMSTDCLLLVVKHRLLATLHLWRLLTLLSLIVWVGRDERT